MKAKELTTRMLSGDGLSLQELIDVYGNGKSGSKIEDLAFSKISEKVITFSLAVELYDHGTGFRLQELALAKVSEIASFENLISICQTHSRGSGLKLRELAFKRLREIRVAFKQWWWAYKNVNDGEFKGFALEAISEMPLTKSELRIILGLDSLY